MAFDFDNLKNKFGEVLEIVAEDLKSIKTGRAKPALVEDVMAEAYNTRMPLKELASISAPDPNLLVVSAWDQSVVGGIEKALFAANFNPVVDGQVIRVAIAQLTGEKREEMIRSVHQKIESGKQMIRAVRTETKKEVEGQKGAAGISEDDVKADEDELDKIAHEYTKRLEELGTAKEDELRKI